PRDINPRQYWRILERREAREKLKKACGDLKRKPYIYESRHKRAVMRPRGPDGRFLRADGTEAPK
ncbi:hypothetical protein K469DRAFT_523605, partial [Zopfia rhizophila CBS 207.26]